MILMISVIIPVHNEVLRLPRTMEDLYSSLSGMDYAIILSEDGSSDGSKKLIQFYAQNNSRVRCLTYPERLGKGLALKRGVDVARGDVIVFFDADSSVSADQIPHVLKELVKFDVLIGSRGLKNSILLKRPPLHRVMAGKIYNWLFRLLFHIPIRDTQCGLKVFRREVIKDLMDHLQIEGWGFDPNLIVEAYRRGYSVKEIPIVWSHSEGSKLSVRKQAIDMFTSLLQIWFSIHKRQPTYSSHGGLSNRYFYDRVDGSTYYKAARSAFLPRRLWHNIKNERISRSLPNGNILDVGCGSGALRLKLPKTANYVGIDLGLNFVKFAKRTFKSDAFIRCDAHYLPFKPERFDGVVCSEVLEHVKDPEKVLDECSRVLRKGAPLIISVPKSCLRWGLIEFFWSYIRRAMIEIDHSAFTPKRLNFLLSTNGFTVKENRAILFGSLIFVIAESLKSPEKDRTREGNTFEVSEWRCLGMGEGVLKQKFTIKQKGGENV